MTSASQEVPVSFGYYPPIEFFRWNFAHPVNSGGKTEYLVVWPKTNWCGSQTYLVSRVSAETAYSLLCSYGDLERKANQAKVN